MHYVGQATIYTEPVLKAVLQLLQKWIAAALLTECAGWPVARNKRVVIAKRQKFCLYGMNQRVVIAIGKIGAAD